MSHIEKVEKYCNKFAREQKIIYLHKIAYHLLNESHKMNQTGGGIRKGNLDSLLNYLRGVIDDKARKTKRKYFVILYGPPASGKTVARKVACNIINMYFDETELSPQDIYKTFVDTGVDEITYNVVSTMENNNNRTVQDVLIENNNDILGQEKTVGNARNKIKELVASSSKIYRNDRADSVSELMYFLSVFLEMNVFFETASGSAKYIDNILSNLRYYGYIPIVIYPFVNDINILYQRSLQRGLKEGRYLHCDTKYGIQNNMKLSLENYPELKKILELKDIEYAIYMYDANFSSDIYQQLNNYVFNELDKKTLERIISVIQEENIFKKRYIIRETHKDFNEIVQLNTECQ